MAINDIMDHNGNTLLHAAVKEVNAKSVANLIKQGANANIKNFSRQSAVDIAIRSKHLPIINLLIANGDQILPQQLEKIFNLAVKNSDVKLASKCLHKLTRSNNSLVAGILTDNIGYKFLNELLNNHNIPNALSILRQIQANNTQQELYQRCKQLMLQIKNDIIGAMQFKKLATTATISADIINHEIISFAYNSLVTSQVKQINNQLTRARVGYQCSGIV